MVFNDYKDTLKSYIHDDDKLVTYKWLSKEFEIHVNAAKDILKQYWEKLKNDEQVTATFLLIGQLKDESLRVEVVRDSDLENAKSKFVKVHCEHVYSLQKSLPDIQQLAFSGEGDLRYSAIKCNGISIREPQVIRKDKDKAEIESKTQNGQIQKKSDESKKDGIKSSQEKNKGLQNQKSKDSPPKETAVMTAKNDDSKEKSGKLSKEKQPKKKTEGKKPNGEQKKENKLNFFAVKPKEVPKEKANEDKKEEAKHGCSEKSKNNDDQESKSSKQSEEVSRLKKSEDSDKQKVKNDEKHTTKNDKKTKSDSQKAKTVKNSRGTKRNRSQENSTSTKRKRIVVIDSSEDESGGSSNEVEEEPMEVVEEPVKKPPPPCPSPPTEKCENGKRMVRKTVDKVYKDENGYLVTKREFTYEPAPEEEECLEVKKEEPKKSKPVETKAKKQTSLMSFFKKS